MIYDRKLLSVMPGFRAWVGGFARAYGVTAGEDLKRVENFAAHMRRIVDLCDGLDTQRLTILTCGGGSTGDFGGFVASLLKRGVRLVHLPTTWLAALDSAHGGKTALNVGPYKNQIGTFYPAHTVVLVRAVLQLQPEARVREAYGELAKIALIEGGPLARRLEAARPVKLWTTLPHAIAAKMRVVRRDPFEKNGQRQLLNLGHTLGHILEAEMGLPHGVAVLQGLFFSLAWGKKRGLTNAHTYLRAMALLKDHKPLNTDATYLKERPRVKRARQLLAQDKKSRGGNDLNFLFVKRLGQVVRVRVTRAELLDEARLQGWIQV